MTLESDKDLKRPPKINSKKKTYARSKDKYRLYEKLTECILQ